MPVNCTEEGRVVTARVTGELDHHGARAVMAALDEQIRLTMPTRLTVDLSGLTFTDSSGIAVLLRTWRHMGEVGGQMTVVHTPPQARRVFLAAGLDKLIAFT